MLRDRPNRAGERGRRGRTRGKGGERLPSFSRQRSEENQSALGKEKGLWKWECPQAEKLHLALQTATREDED